MSTAATVTQIADEQATVIIWPNLNQSETGDSVSWGNWADRSVQISGTLGTATIAMQGSNDGTTWVTLTDPQGNPLSRNSGLPVIEAVLEATRFIRAAVTGGDGTTDLRVVLYCRRP